ncbi:MAG: tyrosine-protein phosphatase [Xenococcaceae cyanobacterium MO_188.B32]|nr:tyrosine-protein phosphatase [Xenococcaceae cyanobacterium MO_188.B32]
MKQPENVREPGKRHLPLTGCLNLRELGGYATADGKLTRWRTLLRGDSLHKLSLESQQAIIDYGVKTIIDLRTISEVNKKPYILSSSPEIGYFNLPLLEEDNFPQLWAKKTLFKHNCFMLEERSPQIKEILSVIATQQTAFVIHCAAGKDRTGIIIALLLAIANVPVATIAQDYALSEKYVSPLYATIQEQAIEEGFAHILLSPPEAIIDTFNYLDEHYGGINEYLQAIGMDKLQIEHLQNILIN